MARGLQESTQSVDVELLPLLVVAHQRVFRKQYQDTPPRRLDLADRIDLVCRARDDAEARLLSCSSPQAREGDEEQQQHPGREEDKRVWNSFTVP